MRHALLLSFCAFLIPTIAHAADCPAGLPSCKVLILSPDEEKFLTAPNGILDTAAQARSLDLGKVVAFFYQKIATAPQGEVKPVKEQPEKPAIEPAPKADIPVPTPDPRK